MFLKDVHGNILKQFSNQPAEHVWRLSGERLLVWDSGKLRIIDKDPETEKLVSTIPTRASCTDDQGQGQEYQLDYQPIYPASIYTSGAGFSLADLPYDAWLNLDVFVCFDTGRVYGVLEPG